LLAPGTSQRLLEQAGSAYSSSSRLATGIFLLATLVTVLTTYLVFPRHERLVETDAEFVGD